MSVPGILQIVLYVVVLLAITKPVGLYMVKVFGGERTFLSPVIQPVERLIYHLTGVDPNREQRWTGYVVGMVLFNLMGVLAVYSFERLQQYLPLNPAGLGPVSPPDLAWNTAVSFTSNTNWQFYSGESTMSYFTQMAGLAVQNFASAATGIAIAIALVRGLTRRSANTLGNFWTDLVRATLYVLLPLSVVIAILLVWQGVPQNFNGYVQAHTIQGVTQTIPQGPVASQEAIKELGTNGGGFFNANSAHPYENPTPLSNFIEMLAIFTIGAGIVYTFGRMAGNTKQGWAILAAMLILFLAGIATVLPIEQGGNPLIAQLGVDQHLSALQAGGNFEGKEVRFGMSASALFTVITTDASCGAVNNMHDSLLPLAGMIPMLNIQLGEIIIGGVGAGLYGMLVFAILAVFIAGLMVGRTPEYLGKKVQSFEIKMAMLTVLILALSILGFTGLASVTSAGTSTILNPGPHGFSEMLYAYSSGTGNNGSAFAGLGSNLFWDVTMALAMFLGRYMMHIPILALAGSMARKQRVAPSLGTFPTTGGLWVGLLVGVAVIVGALTYFPALALGPVAEQLLMAAGKTF